MGKVFHIGHGNTNDDESWSAPHLKDKVIEYALPESIIGSSLGKRPCLLTNSAGQYEAYHVEQLGKTRMC